MREQGARPTREEKSGRGERGVQVRPGSKGYQRDEGARATVKVRIEIGERWRLLRPGSKPTRWGHKGTSVVEIERREPCRPAISVSKGDQQDRGG